MSFNGTAGTWRISAIRAAGGWHHDTLTEDLDLSYRAQLKGWKFIFLPDLTAPAELPPEMSDFKAQQFRWTKGGAQTAIKMLPKVMLSKAPWRVKVEAFFHLTSFTVHLYMITLVLMLFPALYIQSVPMEAGSWWRGLFDMGVFTLATLSASVFYVTSQLELLQDWRLSLRLMPMLMALGIGTSISNTKAIIEAFLDRQSEFVRTPKYGTGKPTAPAVRSRQKRKFNWLPYVEFVFGLYMVFCTVCSLINYKRAAMSTPFLMIFAFGFFYVSIMTFQGEYQRVRKTEVAEAKL
jgi:hypothetical protein